MITQIVLWVPLAVIGAAAFAALGLWAAITDEQHRAQRRAIGVEAQRWSR